MYTHDFRMGLSEGNSGKLIRIDKRLHRLTSTGMYYAVIRHVGKLHRRSMDTTIRATTNRKVGGRAPDDHGSRQAGRQGDTRVAVRRVSGTANEARKFTLPGWLAVRRITMT
jgi:hypothetical protein